MSTAIASLTDCSRSLDLGDARLDPTTPVSKCITTERAKRLAVFDDDFTVAALKSFTYHEFVEVLEKKEIPFYLCRPIADDIIAIWTHAVFKKGT